VLGGHQPKRPFGASWKTNRRHKVKEFNKPNLTKLRQELNHALSNDSIKELTQKLGIEIDLGKCSYSETEATFKLTVLIAGADTQEQTDLKQMVELHELDISKTPKLKGQEIQLVGYLRGRPKWCWVVKYTHSGKRSLIADETAEKLFRKKDSVSVSGTLTETDKNGVPLQQ
jgi:hypothetical protein